MDFTQLLQQTRRQPSYPIDFSKTALIVVDMMEGQVRSDAMLMTHFRQLHESLPDWFLGEVEQSIIPNIQQVLTTFRNNNSLIVHTQFCTLTEDYSDLPLMCQIGNHLYEQAIIDSPEARASAFISELQPLDDEIVIIKSACSAFEGTTLEKILRRNAIDKVVVVGVFTNMCITGTVRSAFDKGFDALVISDACGDMTPYLHDSALTSIESFFAAVCTTQQFAKA